MSKRKKSKSSKSKLPTECDGFKEGDEVVYVRLSDRKTSLGTIRYFHLGEKNYATVIDLLLQNFQTAALDDIIKEPSKKLLDSLLIKTKGRRGSRR